MKKMWVCVPTLAAACSMTNAFAQSNMSIYGQLDAVLYQTNQGGKSATSFGSSSDGASFWGLTGNEDIGGGMKASFDLRSEITMMTGQAASTSTSATNAGQTSTAAVTQNVITNAGDKPSFFNRNAYIKLDQSGVGSLTIGRQADVWWAATGELNNATGNNGGFNNLIATQINSGSFLSTVSGQANSTVITNFAGSASAAGTNVNPSFIGVTSGFMGGFAYTTPSVAGFSGSYQIGVPKVSYNDSGAANNGAAWTLRYDGMGLSVRLGNSYKNDYQGNKAWTQDLIGATYTLDKWKFTLAQNQMKLFGSAIGDNSTVTGAGVFYSLSNALTLNFGYGTLKDTTNSANQFKQTTVNLYYKLSPRTAVFAGIHNGVNSGSTKMTAVYGGNATDTLGATVNAFTMGVKHNF